MSSRSGARNASAVGQRVDRAIARPGRHQRHDGGAAGEGRVHRAQQPRRPARRAGTNGGEMSRKTRSATPRSASAAAAVAKSSEREPLVQPIERVGVRGLQAHRDFEPRRRPQAARWRVERREPAIDARAHERGMRFDDHARQSGERRGHRRRSRPRARRADRRSCRRYRASCRSRARARRAAPRAPPATCAGMAPRGVSATVV